VICPEWGFHFLFEIGGSIVRNKDCGEETDVRLAGKPHTCGGLGLVLYVYGPSILL
jgi:hypothetical protein